LISSSIRYIVHETDLVDFWKGLKADLNPEESDSSWETVLLNRWPNLKAVIAKSRKASTAAECPVHQVWISTRNALNTGNPPKDNPLDRVSRLVYGRPLSAQAKPWEWIPENTPHFTTSFGIVRCAPSTESSETTGLGSGNGPVFYRADAERLTDNQLYGFDFYVPSDTSKLDTSTSYRKAERIALLCCLSRDALRSENWTMNVGCDDPVQIFYWFNVVSTLVG
jgi:hypothetical protein